MSIFGIMQLQSFDAIYQQFPGINAMQWKEQLIKDLKGKLADELNSTTLDGITIAPFYTIETTENYSLVIPKKKVESWQIIERVAVRNIEQSNQEALYSLQYGCNTLIFDLENQKLSAEQLDALLDTIVTDAIVVYFQNYTQDNIQLLENRLPNSCTPFLYIPQQESTVNELLFAIQHLFSKDATQQYIVNFTISQHFFLQIAKFRAFRWLVNQLNQIHKKEYSYLLYTETGFQHRNDDCIENNILRNTTEAMSAIIGNCDGMYIYPHQNTKLGKRIALNTHNLLYYESHFAQLPDVTQSSYFIEYLTYMLAKKVWEQLN